MVSLEAQCLYRAPDVMVLSKYTRQLMLLLLLLPLSCFSRVQLCATRQTAAHQALPSMGFSRQEYWSGLPLPSLILLLGYILKISRGMLQLRWWTMARSKYPHHAILDIGRISRMWPMQEPSTHPVSDWNHVTYIWPPQVEGENLQPQEGLG